MMNHPFDPWQRWSTIHAGELLPDGSLRFRFVLIIVARQNGKTEIVAVLVPYWMFVTKVPQTLGTSTKLPMAKRTWKKSKQLIERAGLDELLDRQWYRTANGEVEMWTPEKTAKGEPWGASYVIDVSNEEGGRSLSCKRVVLDELRQHHDYSAWGASVRTMGAQDDAQAWLLSNAGSIKSVVLNEQRAAAIKAIESGDTETDIFLAEWSAPEDADPEDIHALAQANPNMNRRGQRSRDLLADARRAVAAGGAALTEFKTEVMCINVKILNPAIDPGAWLRCKIIGDLSALRSRVAACIDVAPDGLHATLTAAAVQPDGRVRVEPVRAWDGPGCADRMARDLPAVLARVKPRALGWFPAGPAAAVAARLRKRTGWPPAGMTVEEIKGETAAVCMGFAEQVTAEQVAHSGDPLQDDHVDHAEKLMQGNVWVFSRKGDGHVDAAYAAAGAAHLARTLPPPVGKPRLIVAKDS
jgi:hypothetical protein